MTAKKPKPDQRTPDLTVEGHSLTIFMDKPRGGLRKTSPGVVTSYDPALAERMKRMRPEERQFQSLSKILEDCLRTAESIRNKRGTELVKLLSDARRQLELIDVR